MAAKKAVRKAARAGAPKRVVAKRSDKTKKGEKPSAPRGRALKASASKGSASKASASKGSAGEGTASALITAHIAALGDRRGETLALVRKLIHEADPEVVEEWKWDVPVWSHDGIVCTGETYKDKVKLTFAKGASLADPRGLFTAKDTGKVRRAIDLRATDDLDPAAFRQLFQNAVAYNQSHLPKSRRS